MIFRNRKKLKPKKFHELLYKYTRPKYDCTEADFEELSKLIVENNFNVYIQTAEGYSALTLAVVHRQVGYLDEFLNALHINDESERAISNAFLLASTHAYLAGIKVFLSNKNFQDLGIIHARDEYGNTALINVCKNSNSSDRSCMLCIEALLNAGINPELINSYEGKPYNALFYSIQFDKPKCVRLLVESGVDLNFRGFDGITPILLALSSGSLETLLILLDNNANLNAIDDFHRTALMFASINGNINCFKRILEYESIVNSINKVDINNNSALMYAAKLGNLQNVNKLLTAGGDTSLINVHGYSAAIFASEAKYSECYVNILKKDAEINSNHKMANPETLFWMVDVQSIEAYIYKQNKNGQAEIYKRLQAWVQQVKENGCEDIVSLDDIKPTDQVYLYIAHHTIDGTASRADCLFIPFSVLKRVVNVYEIRAISVSTFYDFLERSKERIIPGIFKPSKIVAVEAGNLHSLMNKYDHVAGCSSVKKLVYSKALASYPA